LFAATGKRYVRVETALIEKFRELVTNLFFPGGVRRSIDNGFECGRRVP